MHSAKRCFKKLVESLESVVDVTAGLNDHAVLSTAILGHVSEFRVAEFKCISEVDSTHARITNWNDRKKKLELFVRFVLVRKIWQGQLYEKTYTSVCPGVCIEVYEALENETTGN